MFTYLLIDLSGLIYFFFPPEVPKTEKTFEERLILKAFLLKFVNSYAPIFYVAFFKGRYDKSPLNIDIYVCRYLCVYIYMPILVDLCLKMGTKGYLTKSGTVYLHQL